MSKLLNELKPKEKGRIIRVEGEGGIHRRLLDMGLVAGSIVEVERLAPLGEPIEVKVKGCHLALRKEEAAKVQVEVEETIENFLPLTMVKSGELVEVVGIKGGFGLRRRLASMGLAPGIAVRVVNNQMPGPFAIDLKGSRLVLGHGMAQKVLVRVASNG